MSYQQRPPLAIIIALAASLLVSAGQPAHAQITKIRDKVKKAIDETKTKPDSSADKKKAAAEAKPGATQANSTAPTNRKEWANYDFVPGTRTIFFSDFTDDQVGNFPKRLEFKTGQMEVVELDGSQRALKASGPSELIIPLPEALPSKFTVELDVINRKSRGVAAETFELAGGRSLSDPKSTQVGWGHNGLFIDGGGVERMMTTAKDADIARYVGNPASFRILGDGPAIKLYADEKRLANIPNAGFQRGRALILRLEGRDDEKEAVYVTRIRVAESQKDIYDELSASGRWATQGILFEIGKSDVKPESTPTLKSIAAMLKAHSDLKVEIQGHTDNVGKSDANMTLSQARADAVQQTLVTDYGVDAAQLTAKGYGDTKPVAGNTTPEGRANNRRVEIVKQ